jgi:pseudouridylate synthase / pseudouridine kinase
MSASRGSSALPRLTASLNRGCKASRPQPAYCASQTSRNTGRRGFSSSARRLVPAHLQGIKDILKISEEVADAVATGKPVVALESTIYTHGAFDEDLGLEEVVRSQGAVPAVCGVYHGVATVGLEKHQIQEMVDGNPSKLSRRDFAGIISDVGDHLIV